VGLNPVSARLKPITDWEDMREGREDESWGEGPVLGVVAAMSMGADADAVRNQSLLWVPAQAREFTETFALISHHKNPPISCCQ